MVGLFLSLGLFNGRPLFPKVYLVKSKIWPFLKQSLAFFSYKLLATLPSLSLFSLFSLSLSLSLSLSPSLSLCVCWQFNLAPCEGGKEGGVVRICLCGSQHLAFTVPTFQLGNYFAADQYMMSWAMYRWKHFLT